MTYPPEAYIKENDMNQFPEPARPDTETNTTLDLLDGRISQLEDLACDLRNRLQFVLRDGDPSTAKDDANKRASSSGLVDDLYRKTDKCSDVRYVLIDILERLTL